MVRNLGSGGPAYNAQLVNSPTVSTSDAVVGSGAISFTAASLQYVQIPPFTTGSRGLTFALWFKMSASASSAAVFGLGNGSPQDNIYVYLDGSNNDLFLGVYQGAEYSKTGVLGRNVNDGLWRHVAWTVDATGNWAVYLNGALTNYYSTVLYPSAISRLYNYLGRGTSSSYPYFNGAIDEFYVFQFVATVAQIQELYHLGKMLYLLVFE